MKQMKSGWLEPSFHLHDSGRRVVGGEGEAVFTSGHYPWKVSSIWNDVPGEGHGDVLMVEETISVIPEVILCVHRTVVEEGILTAQDDLVPQNNLIEFISLSFILCCEVKEDLLDVPIEQGI